MENIINYLNDNSSAVIALFTIIYVIGTFLMWWEMRKTRIKLDESNIQITLEPQARWGNFFDLVIRNIGNVPVYDLELDINPKNLKTIGDTKLEDLNLFKKSIPVFGINQKISTFAISYVDFINSDQSKNISFIAKYKDGRGKQRIQKYDFDMEIYMGTSASSEKSLKDVVEQMEKIVNELKNISKNKK
jgi:hypothetical protein